jgi:hypothetical protein
MVKFEDPTCRNHEGMYSTSSCANASKFAWGGDGDEDEGVEKLRQLPFDGLVPFFTKYAHADLPAAVWHLMTVHDVAFTCSHTLLEEEDTYWTTGNESQRNYCKIANLDAMTVSAGPGHLAQAMVAGLASLHKNGARNRPSTKAAPHFFAMGYDAKQSQNDIQVNYKFHGQRVCMQLMGNSPLTDGLNIHFAAGSW